MNPYESLLNARRSRALTFKKVSASDWVAYDAHGEIAGYFDSADKAFAHVQALEQQAPTPATPSFTQHAGAVDPNRVVPSLADIAGLADAAGTFTPQPQPRSWSPWSWIEKDHWQPTATGAELPERSSLASTYPEWMKRPFQPPQPPPPPPPPPDWLPVPAPDGPEPSWQGLFRNQKNAEIFRERRRRRRSWPGLTPSEVWDADDTPDVNDLFKPEFPVLPPDGPEPSWQGLFRNQKNADVWSQKHWKGRMPADDVWEADQTPDARNLFNSQAAWDQATTPKGGQGQGQAQGQGWKPDFLAQAKVYADTFGKTFGETFSRMAPTALMVGGPAGLGRAALGAAGQAVGGLATAENVAGLASSPLGIAGIAVVGMKLVVDKLKDFAEELVEANRRLAQYNGAMATAYHQLNVSDFYREKDVADRTEGGGVALVKAIDRMRDSLQEGNVLWKQLSNELGVGAASFVSVFGETLGPFQRLINDLLGKDASFGAALGESIASIMLVPLIAIKKALIALGWLKDPGKVGGKPGPWDLFALDAVQGNAAGPLLRRPPRPGWGPGP